MARNLNLRNTVPCNENLSFCQMQDHIHEQFKKTSQHATALDKKDMEESRAYRLNYTRKMLLKKQ